MAYIGAEPLPGQNREVDDISSSFNGSTTAFTLQVNGLNTSPETANNILVNIGGVIQNPGTDYTIAASTITFTTAPAAGLSFFALILGAGINTATVADDTIGSSKLIDTAVTAGSYTTADITVDAQGRITAAASGTIANAEIANNAVTTAKIADSTGASDGVTTAKLATDAVTAAKLASNSVVSDSIVDGSIVNADVNASAAIAGSKISPDFGSQAISTTGGLSINGATVFNESGANVDFRIEGDTDANLFNLDASADAIGIGAAPITTGPKFEVTRSTSDAFVNATDCTARLINSDTSANTNQTSLQFTTKTTSTGADSAIVSQAEDASGNSRLEFWTDTSNGMSEKMVINAAGNVGIGTSIPANDGDHHGLTLAGKANSGAGMLTFQDSAGNNDGRIFADNGVLVLYADPDNASGSSSMVFRVDSSTARLRLMSTNEGFRMGGASDQTFDQLRVASGTSPQGCIFREDGSNITSTSNQGVYRINRTSSDGTMINFLQNGTSEGSIAVSGSTVSYNGGHLSRWSQLSGISSTDKSARPTIYQGTVMSNLDELCSWTHADLLYKEDILYMPEETLPEGKSVGDIKHAKGDVLRAGYTEENQQLNMTKVSDVDGDKDVAGVFWAWDDDDDDIVNDFYIAMTGDMVIRVAASTTVARGDLLISAGDGTAKPQADDIIRSSTIAKIISTNHTATYADGSKAYPCVLMAC